LFLVAASFFGATMRASADVLVATNATWKYLDNGSDQGTAWRAVGFSDSGWSNGVPKLGYGNGDETTVVGFGPDPNNKYITTYFRSAFVTTSANRVTNLVVRVIRDDGAVVYVNGTEVFRSNMPGGPVSYTTLAATTVGGVGDEGINFYSGNATPGLLVNGTNVLAVEIHQVLGTSSDISF